ncbi:MAG: TraR/DksA C4-type zinc finger protein [Candidatus Paceibacterota bacterium]|jgi:RNA polymerase-binding transcription factor DksA|nr:TraR/DksA C4-type zinc finger protein [bacterium]
MNPELLKELKKTLEENKIKLEEELKSFATKNKVGDDWNVNFPAGENCDDVECEEDEVEEYENLLPVEHALELTLRDVNAALERIEKDEYGKCEICGIEIEEERLKAIPEAKTCTEHKV